MSTTNTGDDAPGVKPTPLEPSELGTKEYWDKLYNTELNNHAHDPDDTGTNWFDDSDAQTKLIEFLDSLLGELESESQQQSEDPTQATIIPGLNKEKTTFLDLGTGNGELLFGLREEGWHGAMLGLDYSERSVELALRIREQRGTKDIDFRVHDILNSATESVGKWDVVLDKGTFDAVSLSAATDVEGRRVSEGYRARVLELVGGVGLFLVTSCNWTEEELGRWFEGGGGGDESGCKFEKVGRVEYPSFSFGGVKGQTISSLCFRKMPATVT